MSDAARDPSPTPDSEVADGGQSGASGGPAAEPTAADGEDAHVEDILGDLNDIAARLDAGPALAELREARALVAEAGERGLLASNVRRLDPNDAAEAFVGSVVFASPLLVEDGVFDIGAHLFESTVAGVPVFLLANTAFVVLMTYALLEWTGQDTTEARQLLGVVPARVVMILAISFVVAGLLMTVWGRVTWAAPVEALARINVLWTVGALGAALGDILGDDTPARPE